MAGSTALGGPEVNHCDHDGVAHQRGDGAGAPAAGADDDDLATVTDALRISLVNTELSMLRTSAAAILSRMRNDMPGPADNNVCTY